MSNQPKSELEEFVGLSKVIFAWLNCERLKVIFLGIIASAIIIMIGLGRYQMTIDGNGAFIKIDTYTGKVWVESYNTILKKVEWIERSTYLAQREELLKRLYK